MTKFLVFILGFALISLALAHPPGTESVSYNQDLLPIIDKNHLLSTFLKENFTMTNDPAMGTRIGNTAGPALSGTRIGPYYVNAIWHSKSGDRPVSLTIYTDVQFYDASEKLLGSDFQRAKKLVETRWNQHREAGRLTER